MTGDTSETQILQQIRDILDDRSLRHPEQSAERIYTDVIEPLLPRCAQCAAGMADVTGLGKPPHSDHVRTGTRYRHDLPPIAPCGRCSHDRLVHQGMCRAFGCHPICHGWVSPDGPEPETWTASDHEPPEGVDVLYDTGTTPRNPYPYLVRRPYSSSANAGWGWRVRPAYEAAGPGVSVAWSVAARMASGPLIEHRTVERTHP